MNRVDGGIPGSVHVLGNAGLDFAIAVPRMPAPGETLVGSTAHTAAGGKGLNQAVIASRTGVPTRFLAPLGDDADADAVVAVLAAERFAALDLPRLPGPTDRSVLMVTPDGENCIVTAGACADALDEAAAIRFASAIPPGDILLMQGNLSFAATQAALRCGASRVVLNTAPLRWDVAPLLPYCAVVVANAVEAQAITGAADAAALVAAGARLAVVTLGADGCLLADADGQRHLPPTPARLVDSTGAGDAFCGTFAALLAAGWPPAEAAAAAQRVAARTVERPGAFAALPNAAEIEALLGSAARTAA